MRQLLRFASLFLGSVGAVTAQAEIINISSASSTGVTVALSAGADYTFSYAGAGTAVDTYLGWNPWSNVSGCDVNGAHCTQGFSERFNILGTGGDVYSFSASAGPYATAALANAAAVSGPIFGRLNGSADTSFGSVVPFHQINAINAVFYIPNAAYPDSSGGISLILTRVDAVPEPETYALMFVGLGCVGFATRRRKQQPTTLD